MLEAILVALLILTSILFFTSVQRPSTGTESGGLDLGKVAADTLQVLRSRSFTVGTGSPYAGTLAFDQWMTNLAAGDAATIAVIDPFVKQVLPAGSRYSLRLDNGVSNLTLLPSVSADVPHGARASEILFLPNWGTFTGATESAGPGSLLGATTTWKRFTDPSDIKCIKAPYASSSGTVGSNGPGGASWVSRWQASVATVAATRSGFSLTVPRTTGLEVGMRVTGANIPPGATVTAISSTTAVAISADAGTGSTTASFIQNRVPLAAPLGTWAGFTDGACSAGVIVAKVVSPACAADSTGPGCGSAPTTVGLPLYRPYGVQLVVWYGA